MSSSIFRHWKKINPSGGKGRIMNSSRVVMPNGFDSELGTSVHIGSRPIHRDWWMTRCPPLSVVIGKRRKRPGGAWVCLNIISIFSFVSLCLLGCLWAKHTLKKFQASVWVASVLEQGVLQMYLTLTERSSGWDRLLAYGLCKVKGFP